MTERTDEPTNADLRRIAEGATRGEWVTYELQGCWEIQCGGDTIAELYGNPRAHIDAKYLAMFGPPRTLSMLDELERLRAENAAWREAAESLDGRLGMPNDARAVGAALEGYVLAEDALPDTFDGDTYTLHGSVEVLAKRAEEAEENSEQNAKLAKRVRELEAQLSDANLALSRRNNLFDDILEGR